MTTAIYLLVIVAILLAVEFSLPDPRGGKH